jgi:hypothetical protein
LSLFFLLPVLFLLHLLARAFAIVLFFRLLTSDLPWQLFIRYLRGPIRIALLHCSRKEMRNGWVEES